MAMHAPGSGAKASRNPLSLGEVTTPLYSSAFSISSPHALSLFWILSVATMAEDLLRVRRPLVLPGRLDCICCHAIGDRSSVELLRRRRGEGDRAGQVSLRVRSGKWIGRGRGSRRVAGEVFRALCRVVLLQLSAEYPTCVTVNVSLSVASGVTSGHWAVLV
jgi:hypothetical protein